MKTTKWMGLLAAIGLPLIFSNAQPPPPQVSTGPIQTPSAAPAATNVSPAVAEVMRLAESGVGEDVIVAYIQNSQAPFNLSADQVLYLRDLGLTSPMISAMLGRDTVLRNQPQPVQPAQPAAPPPPPEPAPPVEAPLTPPAPTYVSTPPPTEVNYFYSDLSPYGSWVVLPGYGWCWQPRVVAINHGWRPYCDGGRWIYSDCGWYWYSDYSWGWAPFHYGRWVSHPSCGWVWTPDTVWGPAWVTWRVAGDHCGWAPLPPHAYFDVHSGWHYNGVSVGVSFGFGLGAGSFTFVAVKDFTHHDISHHQVAHSEATKIYNQTTVINNNTVVNNTIVNRGVAVDRVASATHTEIRKAKVQDLPVSAGAGRSVATRSFERSGSVVYRPVFKTAPKPTTPVVAQKVDEQHPVIQHPTLTASRTERTSSTRSVFGPQGASRSTTGAPIRPSPTVTAPSSSKSQPEAPKNGKPTSEKSAPFAPTYSAPRSQQTAPSTTVTPPPTATPPAQSKPVEAPKTPTRSSATYNSDAGSHSSAWGPSGQGQSRSSAAIQSPHVYYPKSYYQANDGRSWGRSSQRQSSSEGSSQPSNSGGSSKSSSSPSKKD